MTITTDQALTTGPNQNPDDQMQAMYDEAYGYGTTALDLVGHLDPQASDQEVRALADEAIDYRDRIADIAANVKDAPVDDEQVPLLVRTARDYVKEAAHCVALLEARANSRTRPEAAA